MKKTTILLIILIYLASIVVIGFFGMKIKVYDEVKYIKSIEMSVEAENPDSFTFEELAVDTTTGNKQYKLLINFNKYQIAKFEKNGEEIDRKYVALSLIPYVTYDTGDVADTQEESITFTCHSTIDYEEREDIKLSNRGQLWVFKNNIAFDIHINPTNSGRYGTGAIIKVYVVQN